MIVIEPQEKIIEYTGTRDELIEGRYATPEMFPEGRKRVKSGGWETRGEAWEVRRIKGGLFRLTRWPEPKGKKPSREKWDPAGYREKVLLHACNDLDLLVDVLMGGNSTARFIRVHRMDEESIEQVKALQWEILRVIRDAEVLPVDKEKPVVLQLVR